MVAIAHLEIIRMFSGDTVIAVSTIKTTRLTSAPLALIDDLTISPAQPGFEATSDSTTSSVLATSSLIRRATDREILEQSEESALLPVSR